MPLAEIALDDEQSQQAYANFVVCSDLCNSNPAGFTKKYPNCMVQYLKSTAMATFHLHIERFHLHDYLDLALQEGTDWPIQVKVMKEGVINGYSLQELKGLVEKGVDLKNLPPHPVNSASDPGSGTTKADHRGSTPPFSLAMFHKLLVNFIVADDQLLHIIKCKKFQCLLLLLKNDLKESDIPHHMKIKSNIIQVWKDYFTILKTDLQISCSCRLVQFSAIQAGVMTKVGPFSMDNAENNTTMMDSLADLLKEQELPLKFITKDGHIMCFAHIINLCIQDIIKDKQEYIAAVRKDPLSHAHLIICAICASGIQPDGFTTLIADGNRSQWFNSMNVLHDVKNQWDSTFFMLNHLCALWPEVDLFVTLPLQQKDLAKFKISDVGWSILQDYEMIFSVPHRVQQLIMSTEARPTLSHAIPSFKVFMTTWENLQGGHPCMAPFIKVSLAKARCYYNQMDNTKAYIILMYPSLPFCWIQMHWGWDWLVLAEESMMTLMKEYHCCKILEDAVTQSSSWPNSLDALIQHFNIGNMALGMPRHGGQQSVQEEYRLYMEGAYVLEMIDPLKFWEV
ncbi:ribonuclease H-like domain-containing protein [Pisolithus croceorrhizus]|nr:ribonuclease H-like domain-containing protein [Pisolithus croceorrhizus]